MLKTGDRLRIDLKARSVNVLINEAELERRREILKAQGGYAYPESQTPWQVIHRAYVGQLATGAVLENAVDFQKLAQTAKVPRHSH